MVTIWVMAMIWVITMTQILLTRPYFVYRSPCSSHVTGSQEPPRAAAKQITARISVSRTSCAMVVMMVNGDSIMPIW